MEKVLFITLGPDLVMLCLHVLSFPYFKFLLFQPFLSLYCSPGQVRRADDGTKIEHKETLRKTQYVICCCLAWLLFVYIFLNI